MIKLSEKWAPKLSHAPETGMGYQIVSVTLNDGRIIEQVVVVGGSVTKARGYAEIPFSEHEIRDIVVTHATWDGWNK